MAETLRTSLYQIYNTDWGRICGYASYSTSESNDKVTVSCSALGEASTEGPGTYTETASASLSLTFGGNTVASGSFSSSRSRVCEEGSYKYYPTGNSGSKSISKGTTATTATLKLTYTIRGNSYTGSVSISIPALTKHTVSYNANGGSGAPSAQTKYYGQNITLSSTIPTRAGYTFMGWGTSSTDTTVDYVAGATYSVNSTTNVTLYAIWKKDITLSYNVGSGSGAPASQTKTIYNATTSTSFEISSTIPTRSNYNFLGWLDGSTLYQPGNTITEVTDNKELIASWELAYIPPQITSLQGARLENNNSQAKITINWTKGNNGSDIATTQLSIAYKLSTSSTWIYVTNTTGSTSSTETWINSSNTSYETTINTSSDNQYDIQVKVRNSSYTSYVQTKTSFISATFYVIDITADGRGIGLLTTAPDKGIALGDYITNDLTLYKSSGDSPSLIFQRGTLTDSYNDWRIYDKNDWLYFGHRGSDSTDWPTSQEWCINTTGKFSGYVDWDKVIDKPALVDWIVERNTSGNWTYEKWDSGVCKAWYYESFNVQPSFVQKATGIYSSDEWATKTISLPSGLFTVVTYANADIMTNSYVHIGVPSYNSTAIAVRVWMDLATSPKLTGLGIEAIGRWK